MAQPGEHGPPAKRGGEEERGSSAGLRSAPEAPLGREKRKGLQNSWGAARHCLGGSCGPEPLPSPPAEAVLGVCWRGGVLHTTHYTLHTTHPGPPGTRRVG